MRLKLTTSMMALMMSLGAKFGFSSYCHTDEDVNNPSTSVCVKNSVSPLNQDKYQLPEDMLSKRRILSLDGGGIRGLIEIASLTVLEGIFNHELNTEIKNQWLKQRGIQDRNYLKISDVFDVFGGTSTGSIVAGGFVSAKNYTALDIMKIYARYGYKIFDENANSVLSYISNSLYGNKGIETLLEHFFKNENIKDIKKPFYAIGHNEKSNEAVGFSQAYRPEDNIRLKDAILVSASAPVYFLPQKLINLDPLKDEKATMSDGGLVANNPALAIYLAERDAHQKQKLKYEIYSFGTGEEIDEQKKEGLFSSGAVVRAGDTFKSLFSAQIKTVNGMLRAEVGMDDYPLDVFFRIQPLISSDKAAMDITTNQHLRYLIDKGFESTIGDTFRKMTQNLGFEMLKRENLTKVHQNILSKVYQIMSDNYDQID